jgi:phosphoserine phosphatase
VTALRRAGRDRLLGAVGELALGPRPGQPPLCFVIDADRTLAPQDTGRLVGRTAGVDDAIRDVFEALGYVEEAFSRVAQVWAKLSPDQYLAFIHQALELVGLRNEWLRVLDACRDRVPVVVITAGIPHVWRLVLARNGHETIPVIGGCHQGLDEYVVCPETKAELVTLLRQAGWTVAAAGDSPIDLLMLELADIAIFVPDHKGSPGLRAELHRVPGIRHLIVDDRRFDGLETCTADDLVGLIVTGEWRHAHRPHA